MGFTPPFFLPDSRIPPVFGDLKIHCCHRDLRIVLEVTGGDGASF